MGHELHLRKYLPKTRRRLALNVGAHHGMWCEWMSALFDRVVAVEADPANAEVIRRRAFPNVEVLERVAWCESGHRLAFNCRQGGRDQEGSVACRDLLRGQGVSQCIQVPSLAIDSLGLDACDMIVMDVEGVEIQAMQGCTRTIERFRPDLIVECHEIEHQEWLRVWLSRSGYNVTVVHHPGFGPDHPVKNLVGQYYRGRSD